MNKHIQNILYNKDKNFSLLENVLTYIENNKDMDIFDIADIIKNDKTFFDILYHECKNNNLFKEKSDISIKFTDFI